MATRVKFAPQARRKVFLVSCGVLGLVAALSDTAYAADSSAATDSGTASAAPEIVVSATRRGDQTLLKVPQAIDAYSGDTLKQYHVSSIEDLTKLNPSLTVMSMGATQQQLIIRGISSSVGQTTGIYLDEAPLLGGFNANAPGDGTPSLRLHDVDHVEVLKGPQGTLFGASSMDGTLRVVTAKPDLEKVTGSVNLTGSAIEHGNGYFGGDAAINLPLVKDKVALRVVGWTEQGGGYIDKIQPVSGNYGSNVNNEHLAGGRAMLRIKPTDDLTLDFAAVYQHASVNGPQYATSWVGGISAPAGAGAYTNYDPVAEYYHETYQLYTAVGDYDLGFGDVVLSGSYGRKKMLDVEDTSGQACANGLCSNTPAWPVAYNTDLNFRNYTAEARFSSKFRGPFQIVAGAYYDNEQRQYYGAAILANPQTGQVACETYFACSAAGLIKPGFAVSPVVYANGDRFEVGQYALYAQGDYKIVPNVTLTVGGRYFEARITDQASNQQNVYPDYIFGQVTTPSVGDRYVTHQHKMTYNFALLWEATHDVSLYARAASGFRIGGINNSASIAAQSGTPIPATYAPDSLWDYEVGAKFFLLDRKLSFDISAYHIDWSGQQVNALAAGTYNYEVNAGLTKTDGVEASATLRPTTNLTLAGSITYVNARLADDLPAAVVAAGTPGSSGDRLPMVPHWTINGRGEYTHDLGASVKGYVLGDFNYRAASYSIFRPVSAAQLAAGVADDYYTRIAPFLLLNLRVGARFDGVDVSAFINNVTNKYAVMGIRADANSIRNYTAQPRSFGLSASYKF